MKLSIRSARWNPLPTQLGAIANLIACILIVCMQLMGMQMMFAVPVHAANIYSLPRVSAGEPTWIVDDANLLSRATEGVLTQQLTDLANQTGYEVRFVTVHRLYDQSPDAFAQALFQRWFPTADEQANQVLLVLDDVGNGSAIQVGDGVKTVLLDDIATSVAEETLMVPLRDGENRYNQAFTDAGDRLVAVLSGEADPGPPEVRETVRVASNFIKPSETERNNATVVVIGLLVAATVIPMVTYFIYQAMT